MNLGGEKTADRQSEVAREMDYLEKAIEQSFTLGDQYSERLSAVLTVEVPLPEKGESEVEPELCHLAHRIRHLRKRVQEFNKNAMNLLDRVQL